MAPFDEMTRTQARRLPAQGAGHQSDCGDLSDVDGGRGSERLATARWGSQPFQQMAVLSRVAPVESAGGPDIYYSRKTGGGDVMAVLQTHFVTLTKERCLDV